MTTTRSLISGAVGASVLTAVHQLAKFSVPHAPRVDVIGRRAIAAPIYNMGLTPPHGSTLQSSALALDLISNTLYYAALGLGRRKNLWRNATALGVAAGLSALALPPLMRLGSKPTSRTTATSLMTIAWYTLGALATAASLQLFEQKKL